MVLDLKWLTWDEKPKAELGEVGVIRSGEEIKRQMTSDA